MNDQTDNEHRSLSRDENGERLRFKGIVDSGEDDGEPIEWDESLAAPYAEPLQNTRGPRWNAASRQMWLLSKLAAVFLVFAVILGWPLGDLLAYLKLNNGSLDGWSIFDSLAFESYLLAIFVPILVLLIGYIMSRQMTMMSAAEQIASAAQQFIQPNASAAENARSVGAVVRGEMQALNVGLDGALTRLASVEAMIRQHVEAIETAGASIEQRAAGAVTRVSDERMRLIDLTEQLNHQADAFAAAIAEKAQASIAALHSADDLSERAQSQLEERLGRLDAAAQNALASFNALSEALGAADETMRARAGVIDSSAAETRAATERATRAAEAAAEAAARNAANVGAAANRASDDARKAAENAIEIARQEAERAAGAAFEAAEREARRVSEQTGRLLGDVRRSTEDLLSSVADDTGRATNAAEALTAAARQSAEASAKASADIAKATDDAKRNADSALAYSEESSKKIEARNKALAEARAALETENLRLEALIEEQRKRADRLADAIASQTERLSKLAESQLREQEASVRLAEAQAAARAREEAAAKAAKEEAARQEAARLAAEKSAAEKAAAEQARAEKKAAAEKAAAEKARLDAEAKKKAEAEKAAKTVLDLGAASRSITAKKGAAKPAATGPRERLDAMAADIAQRRQEGAQRREPPLSLDENDKRRDKQKVSWREILDATDDAEPLDLASAANPKPPQSDGAANAIRIISELQNFTLDLESRLYGEPPPALRERFDRGDRNIFANRILRLNESDVKRRIRMESGRDKRFERDIHDFLQGFERLLEDATTSQTADEDLEEYLSSPLGRVYLLIGATVGYFA